MLAFCRLFEQLDRTSASGLPAWLFDDCHAQVGDSAETVALLWAQVAPSERLVVKALARCSSG